MVVLNYVRKFASLLAEGWWSLLGYNCNQGFSTANKNWTPSYDWKIFKHGFKKQIKSKSKTETLSTSLKMLIFKVWMQMWKIHWSKEKHCDRGMRGQSHQCMVSTTVPLALIMLNSASHMWKDKQDTVNINVLSGYNGFLLFTPGLYIYAIINNIMGCTEIWGHLHLIRKTLR